MKVLYVASEVGSFAKTGGLADVAGSLPPALARRGLDVAVMMPLYRSVRQSGVALEKTGITVNVPVGAQSVAGRLWKATLPDSTVPIYFVEEPEFFDRDDPAAGRGIYQFRTTDGKLADYTDNAARFGFFSRAVLEAIPRLGFWPDILHTNDWQTGLVPVYLRSHYHREPRFRRICTAITIHNLAYQGRFWHFDMPLLHLGWELFTPDGLEFFGHINCLKGGIVYSDLITTVSPTYAREIQTPYYGCGLQGVLMQRMDKLHGIVNGVDYGVWDPATDIHLAANFSADSFAEGKARCKADLQQKLGLDVRPRPPLFGIVSRLADQKGFDLIAQVLPDLLHRGVQLAVLGEGEPRYRTMLEELGQRFPRQVGARFGFNEALAHQIEAGVDAFLMPSRYEPCGLNQLYSLKYGTPPVVRATGGLADTVVDASRKNLLAGTATGFTFVAYSAEAFRYAIDRCLQTYEHQAVWRDLQQTGMKQDWSWARSAAEYERLYRMVVSGG